MIILFPLQTRHECSAPGDTKPSVRAFNVAKDIRFACDLFETCVHRLFDGGRGEWASIALIVAVVAATLGALGYIYRDRIFGS